MTIWNYQNSVFSNLNNIFAIQEENEKQKLAQEFAKNLAEEYGKDVNFIADRFLEIGSNVKAAGVPKGLMDSLKESIFCYVNGQYLSTIATVGITAELFCVHLYKMYLEGQGHERSMVKRRIGSFSNISQNEKIETLFSVIGINEHVCQILHEIRKRRNDNVHPHFDRDYKDDALDCLQNVVDVLNMYTLDIESLENQPTRKKQKNKKSNEKS